MDLKADNSFKIIMETINSLNLRIYSKLLEHDMIQLLNKEKSIEVILPFFTVTRNEDEKEVLSGKINMHCNFEVKLIGDNVPLAWDKYKEKSMILNDFQ